MHGVEPVKQAPPKNEIPALLSMRWPLKIWNWLFLSDGVYQPKPAQSAEWNRGAYLVQGPRTAACHTPRGIAMGEVARRNGRQLRRGFGARGWDGYNITSDANAGIGGWTQQQLVQYLRSTGSVPGLRRRPARWPRRSSTASKMTEADIGAISTYIRTVPAVASGDAKQSRASCKPAEDGLTLRGVAIAPSGIDPARLYLGNCATCHQMQGKGTPDGYYPPLFHNSTVGASNPTNLVQVILNGVAAQGRQRGRRDAGIPPRAVGCADAALTNYLTGQFGNPAAKVTEQDVAKLR